MKRWDKSFRLPRIGFLQPEIITEKLDDQVEKIDEQIFFDIIENIFHLWAESRVEITSRWHGVVFEINSVERQIVSFVSIQTQSVKRWIEKQYEPANKISVNTDNLVDRNPLKIIPLENILFPENPVLTEHRIPGDESICDCEHCKAAGYIPCNRCKNTGRLRCVVCAGARRLRCTNCDATGLIRRGNTSVDTCPTCRSAGSRPCDSCDADGSVECSECNGDGNILCIKCNAYGRICTFNMLSSLTETNVKSSVHMPTDWPIDFQAFSDSMIPIWSDEIPFQFSQAGSPATYPIDYYNPKIPTSMLLRIRSSIHSALTQGSVVGSQAQTALGIRISIRACYVYRISYMLNKKNDEEFAYIGGLDNRVAAFALYKKLRSRKLWFQYCFFKFLRTFGLFNKSKISRKFIKRITSDGSKIHMLDVNAVVAEAIENVGLDLTVQDFGYDLLKEKYNIAKVELTYDESKRNAIVKFMFNIGDGLRDKFVDALHFNKSLTFGRIALASNVKSGKLEFKLIDVRLYNELTAESYLTILDYLLNVAKPKTVEFLSSLGRSK